MTVAASRYAVTTQESWSRPPSSPTIVGRAVDTIVWSSEASSIASSSPENVSSTRRRSGRVGSAVVASVVAMA